MNRCLCVAVCLAGVLAGACGGPPVVAEGRGPFDTVNGLYGGNEFSALSPEGKRSYAGDPPEKTATNGSANAPAPTPPPAPTPVAAAAAMPATLSAPQLVASAAAPAAAASTILIDANAFGAVFSGTSGSVKPTPEQLMQLDSLSLITAEPLRSDLQRKLLACRHAGDGCRLAAH